MSGRGNWFSPMQRRFLLVVLSLLGVVLGAVLLSEYRNGRDGSVSEGLERLGTAARSGGYYAVEPDRWESFVFDPNEADSTMLLRLGLAPFQVRAIYRYRAKGGRYSEVEDFARVYRMTVEQWEHLRPLVRIGRRYRLVAQSGIVGERPVRGGGYGAYGGAERRRDSVVRGRDSVEGRRDSVRASYPKKFDDGVVIDVNVADSATLCRVPGIGVYNASRIVRFRRRLGGFVDVRQLLELEGFPADALAWLEVRDSAAVQRLDVNHMSERRLMRHPYMGYYRAAEIVAYRRVHGSLPSIDVLAGLPHFSHDDVVRLRPYLSFD